MSTSPSHTFKNLFQKIVRIYRVCRKTDFATFRTFLRTIWNPFNNLKVWLFNTKDVARFVRITVGVLWKIILVCYKLEFFGQSTDFHLTFSDYRVWTGLLWLVQAVCAWITIIYCKLNNLFIFYTKKKQFIYILY